MADIDDETLLESGLTEREEKKLPQWAKDRLAALRESLDNDEPTKVLYGDIDGVSPKFLNDGPFNPVRFVIDDKNVDLFRKSFGEYEYVLVNSNSSLTVVPLSSNSVALVPHGFDGKIFRSTD